MPHTNKDVFKFLFFPKTIVNWNCLPEAIVSSSSLETFKYRLTAFLIVIYSLYSFRYLTLISLLFLYIDISVFYSFTHFYSFIDLFVFIFTVGVIT